MLYGLAGAPDFGNQTESLVNDIFILNMSNKQVEENSAQIRRTIQLTQYSLQSLLKTAWNAKEHMDTWDTRVKKEPVCAVRGSRQKTR